MVVEGCGWFAARAGDEGLAAVSLDYLMSDEVARFERGEGGCVGPRLEGLEVEQRVDDGDRGHLAVGGSPAGRSLAGMDEVPTKLGWMLSSAWGNCDEIIDEFR